MAKSCVPASEMPDRNKCSSSCSHCYSLNSGFMVLVQCYYLRPHTGLDTRVFPPEGPPHAIEPHISLRGEAGGNRNAGDEIPASALRRDSSEDISLRSAPCSGAYWMPGSPCSRRPTSLGLAQYTLDPVTSSAQKLQHRGSSRSRRRDSLLSLPPPCQVGHCVLQPRTLWFSPFPVFSHPVHGQRSL
ncbi:uncharacterized protein LOC105309493 isoform X3 [Pteropus vampyrus]|uniref:Uncharacterized protein LOC105309493 isoform X3 n=1 Tax=Pteropus vampyrus TaxID=132908 RepID=A0A6P6C3X0_PTEVA|nr:uncharacterized protein LOC105309493 isoform X3 [Pteropus vampyrus]